MTDRRPLSLPAFSEPASGAPLPGQAGGRRLMPVEQGADSRQPPGETEHEPAPAPAPARRPLAPDSPSQTRTAISERYQHGLRPLSRTSSPPSPTALCASASTWTVVVAGPAPASDTVFLYGVP